MLHLQGAFHQAPASLFPSVVSLTALRPSCFGSLCPQERVFLHLDLTCVSNSGGELGFEEEVGSHGASGQAPGCQAQGKFPRGSCQTHSAFSRPCLTTLRGRPTCGLGTSCPFHARPEQAEQGLWGCTPLRHCRPQQLPALRPGGPSSPGAASC